MQEKIMITNILLTSIQDKPFVRITYLLVGKGKLSSNDRFKGYTEVKSYIPNKECFDLITTDLIGKPLDANFEYKQDFKDPLTSKLKLKSIENNGAIINLI